MRRRCAPRPCRSRPPRPRPRRPAPCPIPSSLPDPKPAVGLDNFPVSGPPAGRFGTDEMTMGKVGFSQDMPSAAKRQARIGRAQADIVAAGAEGAVEARQVRVATALAWIELLYAQRKLAALDGGVAQLAPLWSAA